MSTRRRITVAIDGRVAVFKGWRVAELVKEAGAKPIYSASASGWMVDRSRLGDVLAYLEQRNIAVTVIDTVTSTAIDEETVPGAGKRGGLTSAAGSIDPVETAEGGGLW